MRDLPLDSALNASPSARVFGIAGQRCITYCGALCAATIVDGCQVAGWVSAKAALPSLQHLLGNLNSAVSGARPQGEQVRVVVALAYQGVALGDGQLDLDGCIQRLERIGQQLLRQRLDVATPEQGAALYDMLFKAMAQTLRTIAADPKHLGAEIGFIAVLRTWGQKLLHHPHLHCVAPGGDISLDGKRWMACLPGFFLPVRVLSRL